MHVAQLKPGPYTYFRSFHIARTTAKTATLCAACTCNCHVHCTTQSSTKRGSAPARGRYIFTAKTRAQIDSKQNRPSVCSRQTCVPQTAESPASHKIPPSIKQLAAMHWAKRRPRASYRRSQARFSGFNSEAVATCDRLLGRMPLPRYTTLKV